MGKTYTATAGHFGLKFQIKRVLELKKYEKYNPTDFWVCRLSLEEISEWKQGLFDNHAKQLGISGWIVPVIVNQEGIIQGELWEDKGMRLLAAPCLILKSKLCPSHERNIVSQLQGWWDQSETLRLFKKRVLVISGIKNLSSPRFGVKKFKLNLQDVLILGLEEECEDRKLRKF